MFNCATLQHVILIQCKCDAVVYLQYLSSTNVKFRFICLHRLIYNNITACVKIVCPQDIRRRAFLHAATTEVVGHSQLRSVDIITKNVQENMSWNNNE